MVVILVKNLGDAILSQIALPFFGLVFAKG